MAKKIRRASRADIEGVRKSNRIDGDTLREAKRQRKLDLACKRLRGKRLEVFDLLNKLYPENSQSNGHTNGTVE